MSIALANITGALVPLGFTGAAAFLYHESHNVWLSGFCLILAAGSVAQYKTADDKTNENAEKDS